MNEASKKGMTSIALVLIAAALLLVTSCQLNKRVRYEEVKAALEQRDQAIAGLAVAIKDLQTKEKAKWTISKSK